MGSWAISQVWAMEKGLEKLCLNESVVEGSQGLHRLRGSPPYHGSYECNHHVLAWVCKKSGMVPTSQSFQTSQVEVC